MSTLDLKDVCEKIVAIVKFGPAGFASDGTKAGDYFQVTIDPAHVSPSGDYIRFGLYDGDEIIGWQRAAALTICEVLGTYNGNDTPLLRWGNQGAVAIQFLGEG